MIKNMLSILEDPERPLLGPNYWLIAKIGMILPENKLAVFVHIVIHEIVTMFVMTQYAELYVVRSDLDEVLTNLKISMLSIICVIKSNSCVLWQRQWRQLLQYVTEADRYERDTQDPDMLKILNSYTRYCRRITYFYWFLVFLTFATTTTSPLMMYIFSPSLREGLRNGTEPFPHIFSAWVPFDKYHLPGSAVTIIWHVLVCAYGALVMAGYDTTIIVTMVFFGGALELLRERCKQMWSKSGKCVSEAEMARIIKELHTIHVLLMKNCRLFNAVVSPVLFCYVVMCSLMLCASAYQLSIATNMAQRLLLAEYFVFGVAQLFLFCWHSNDVLLKSEAVRLGPYESEWYDGQHGGSRGVLLLAGQLRAPIVFTAGPFTSLTLANFITILKGAYSYYMLVKK